MTGIPPLLLVPLFLGCCHNQLPPVTHLLPPSIPNLRGCPGAPSHTDLSNDRATGNPSGLSRHRRLVTGPPGRPSLPPPHLAAIPSDRPRPLLFHLHRTPLTLHVLSKTVPGQSKYPSCAFPHVGGWLGSHVYSPSVNQVILHYQYYCSAPQYSNLTVKIAAMG